MPLVGITFSGSQGSLLYSLRTDTGAAAQARVTGLDRTVGIAWTPARVLYALTNNTAPNHPDSLFTIDPATGASSLVGSTGLAGITEGDLAFDASTGNLYGLYNLNGSKRQLLTIDIATGAASTVTGSLSGDCSAMAFDADGNLLVIDTALDELLHVDKISGTVNGTTPLSVPLGAWAGMALDPQTGKLYVADGGTGGTGLLYTLTPQTGTLSAVGPTGLVDGLAGLTFLPEPGAFLSTAVSTMVVLLKRRRRPRSLNRHS